MATAYRGEVYERQSVHSAFHCEGDAIPHSGKQPRPVYLRLFPPIFPQIKRGLVSRLLKPSIGQFSAGSCKKSHAPMGRPRKEPIEGAWLDKKRQQCEMHGHGSVSRIQLQIGVEPGRVLGEHERCHSDELAARPDAL